SVRSTVRPAGGLPGRSAASTELARPGRHRRPAFVVPNEGPRGLTRSPGRARRVWATVDVSRNLGRKERTMRRITGGLIAAALALGTTLGVYGTTARAATAYDSAYQFESAFLSLNSGDNGTFSVFFANTGATAWVTGTPSQVNLAVCSADKLTCNISSPQAGWAVNWLSTTAYATAAKAAVPPGDFSAFTYSVKVPAGTSVGTYRFNGDLVVAAQATGGESCTGGAGCSKLHAEGYYQDASIGTSTPASPLSVTPAY